VQACHAAHGAGATFGVPEGCHMAVLAVVDRDHLLRAADKLAMNGIRFSLFVEPDDEMGETALCSEPISGKERRVFRSFSLWKSPG